MATSTTYGGYIAEAADQNIIMKFNRDVRALSALLSASELHVLPAGTNLKTYTNTCTLQDGVVDPNAAITMSTFSDVAAAKELTFKKWGKGASIESIAAQGIEGAVLATDNQLLRDVQKAIRSTIVGGMSSGSGSAEGATFQAALAACWAEVEEAFEDESATPVFFVNAPTFAAYLGSANIQMQTQFGLSYVENFMGIGTIIIDSNVPDDYIYGTAKENLVVAAADISAVPGVQMDESGIIGVCHTFNENKASYETYVYTGLCVFPMFASRVVKAVVDPS